MLFFIYYPQNILTHEASYKHCFGNCSPSPPTSHQNIYRTRLGCIGAEVSTNNNFCNWDVWYQKEPTNLNGSLQLLFLNRMARKVVIAEIPKTNGSLMSNQSCYRQLVIFFFPCLCYFIQMMLFTLSKAGVKCATKTCNLIFNIATKRVEKRCCAFFHSCSKLSRNKSGCWVTWIPTCDLTKLRRSHAPGSRHALAAKQLCFGPVRRVTCTD